MLRHGHLEVLVEQFSYLRNRGHASNDRSDTNDSRTHTGSRRQSERWYQDRGKCTNRHQCLDNGADSSYPFVSHYFPLGFGLGLVVFFGFGYGDTVVAPYVLNLFGCSLIEDAGHT